jgi:hypothetical protein
MLEYPDALKATAFSRASMEVEQTPIAGFLVLLAGAAVSVFLPPSATWRWSLWIAAGLVLLPFPLSWLLPRRGLLLFRLSLLFYLLNGPLLAIIGYREISRVVPLLLNDFPIVQVWSPWVAPLFSALYYVLQFHPWKERLLRLPIVKDVLSGPPPTEALQEIAMMLSQAIAGRGTEWAEFRTVPASPKNWRLFLKLDPQIHGFWRVAFSQEFAIVVFRDGSRMEAVKRGALKIVAEDPSPGARTIQCLLRWNQHLHEGRIRPDHFYRIQAWNKPV